MRATLTSVVGTLALLAPTAALGLQRVDIELVLAVDVSGSVDGPEQELQRSGLASAFRAPEVIDAIRALPNGLAVAVVAWAGAGQARNAVDWCRLTDRRSAEEFAHRIGAAFPVVFAYAHKTAIGDALIWSLAALKGNGFDGTAKIDVSGDGHNTDGAYPHEVRDAAVAAGVTINGLAIINEEPELADYYRRNVVGGPGAFVVTADDFHDFIGAIRLKLIRELAPGPTASR
jgi:hypothetical protein